MDKALLPQRVAVSKGSIQAPAPREPESRTRAAIVALVLVAPPRHLLEPIKGSEQRVSPSGRQTESRDQPEHERVRTQRLPVGRRSQVLDINLVGASPSPSTRRGGSSPGWPTHAARAPVSDPEPGGPAPPRTVRGLSADRASRIGAAIRRDHGRGNAAGRIKGRDRQPDRAGDTAARATHPLSRSTPPPLRRQRRSSANADRPQGRCTRTTLAEAGRR